MPYLELDIKHVITCWVAGRGEVVVEAQVDGLGELQYGEILSSNSYQLTTACLM